QPPPTLPLSLHDALPIFTAPATGTAHATTYGSTYNTVLDAYTGSCLSATDRGCNDDAGSRTQSELSFGVIKNTSYLMEVAQLGRSEEHTSELQSPYDLVC